MNKINANTSNVIEDIVHYYEFSFQVEPEKCTPVLLAIINNLEELYPGLSKRQAKVVDDILPQIMSAMQKQDYVLVRDYLYYELKPLLQSFSISKSKH